MPNYMIISKRKIYDILIFLAFYINGHLNKYAFYILIRRKPDKTLYFNSIQYLIRFNVININAD